MKRRTGYISFFFLSFLIIGISTLLAPHISFPAIKGVDDKVIITTDALVTLTPNKFERSVVKKVIDGDTIELITGEKVRYVGIDTPETKHPTKGVECFGKEASKQNKLLVEGKEILLEKDVSNTDRYDRLLRYIYLPNPQNASQEALFVNRYLVEEGYAHSLTYPPDVKYDTLFRELEQKARINEKGLWQNCD